MELKIFNEILFGQLRPWLFKANEVNELKVQLRKIKPLEDCDAREIIDNISLLTEQIFSKSKVSHISRPTFTTPLSESYDLESTYYKLLIDNAVLFYFNETISNPYIISLKDDVPYQIGVKSLKAIAILSRKANEEIVERDFVKEADNLSEFVLHYFRNSLIALYFSIQDHFQDGLLNVYDSQNQFSMFELEDTSVNIDLVKCKKPSISLANVGTKAFSFGFKGELGKLTNLINLLCTHENFLNESITKPEKFITLLTSEDIESFDGTIHFGCNTNLLVYILEQLKKSCPKLTFANIDRSSIFYSDNGTLIKQSLLSNSKSKNQISKEAKAQIDNIFNENPTKNI